MEKQVHSSEHLADLGLKMFETHVSENPEGSANTELNFTPCPTGDKPYNSRMHVLSSPCFASLTKVRISDKHIVQLCYLIINCF